MDSVLIPLDCQLVPRQSSSTEARFDFVRTYGVSFERRRGGFQVLLVPDSSTTENGKALRVPLPPLSTPVISTYTDPVTTRHLSSLFADVTLRDRLQNGPPRNDLFRCTSKRCPTRKPQIHRLSARTLSFLVIG